MSSNIRRISTSRRAALAGGAALVLGAAAAHTVAAQQAAGVAADPVAFAVGPATDDVLFYSSGTPVDLGQRRTDWLKAVADKLGADPSRARSTGGAGIGLALVKQFVDAHGGTVGVVSAPGHGSCFSFTIPTVPAVSNN